MDISAEQRWLPVVGWEDLYEVSDQGFVRGKRRKGSAGGILKTPEDARGYLQLNLCRDGRPLHTFVHRVVAETFHGTCPPGMECRHLDGDSTNNAASNLKWGTPRENNLDRVRHGTFVNVNTGKTHCDHGHEFTEENTGWRTGRSGRYCIACRKRRNKEQAARRKLARAAR